MDGIKINLRGLRENAWLTQEQACEMLGISHPTLRDFELGNRIPNAFQLQAFASVYRVPVSLIKVGDRPPAR